MSAKNPELSRLLSNIQKGLEHLSVKELNAALEKFLAQSNTVSPEASDIDRVLIIVALKYNINKKNLLRSKARGDFQHARMLSYCLLHWGVGLSVRKIGLIFGRAHFCVTSAINKFKSLEPEKFKEHKKIQALYAECLQEYLQNSSNKNL